jgi:hypothetical protein
MSNIALGVVNLVDLSGTVVTCLGEDPARPATKLQAPEIGDVFRTVDATSVNNVIIVTLENEQAVEGPWALAIIKHNLQASATYTLVFKNAAAATVLTVTARDVDADGYWPLTIDTQYRNLAVYQHETDLTFKSVEITPADTTNPDGYLEVSRLFLGELMEFEVGLRTWNTRWVDASERATTAGGATIHRVKRKYRRLAGEAFGLTETEAVESVVSELDAVAGRTGDVLVLFERSRPAMLQKRMLWGYQEDTGEVSKLSNFSIYSRQLAFLERV